jgi:hypothetical protein
LHALYFQGSKKVWSSGAKAAEKMHKKLAPDNARQVADIPMISY